MRGLRIILPALLCCLAFSQVRADQLVQSVQQALKDQGFYYGEITGQKDADTSAAIRRYQIRNGLQVTGELNAETQKSLGLKGTAPVARATPTVPPAAVVRPQHTPPPDLSDLRDNAPAAEEEDPAYQPGSPQAAPDYPADPHAPNLGMRGVFGGTPFETAPPEAQRDLIIGAQSLLARRGYYRSEIDGVFGPGMEFALRAYQSRFGLEQTGRLDMETLATLGLLPGQPAPGVTAPVRRVYRRVPSYVTPGGERVYVPR
jgi:peptidoglycan hydrolase-like protein with peptidoglycan-binding domain